MIMISQTMLESTYMKRRLIEGAVLLLMLLVAEGKLLFMYHEGTKKEDDGNDETVQSE